MTDASRPQKDKKTAQRLHREAVAQQNLLTDSSSVMQSDFYSYRYFASEGFLPGYNFPRLPLSAYVPSRRRKKREDEFLSRPRFLAISEFGPRAMVYHEGSRYLINRVIMPVQDEDALTSSAKQCEQCGYLHPCDGVGGADLCEYCGHQLPGALTNLFRLQNVSTKRRDRISSDEEERLRMGYELKSGLRFAAYDHKVSQKIATARTAERELFKLAYGHAATLWRINLGWARRRQQNQYGFILDTENGYWARNEQAVDDDPDPMSPQTARVIPFVEDRRNALLLTPSDALSIDHMASLQAALKSAIQVVFQLEESELAAEPLPTRDDRRSILFYEAAEGGAGVLRHLVEDPSCLPNVAREALTLCHFDPDSLTDLRHAPFADEDCEAACYDCLMSYANQRDHEVLDRHLIKALLVDLSKCTVEGSPVEVSRSDHLAQLLRQCDSQLEKKWLTHINERGLRLPARAQHFMEEATARPDFLYDEQHAAVYINGPVHDFPDRQERDRQQFEKMEDLGFTVIVFGHNDDWEQTIAKYPHVFGKLS